MRGVRLRMFASLLGKTQGPAKKKIMLMRAALWHYFPVDDEQYNMVPSHTVRPDCAGA